MKENRGATGKFSLLSALSWLLSPPLGKSLNPT